MLAAECNLSFARIRHISFESCANSSPRQDSKADCEPDVGNADQWSPREDLSESAKIARKSSSLSVASTRAPDSEEIMDITSFESNDLESCSSLKHTAIETSPLSDLPWVGVTYKLKVDTGFPDRFAPLQLASWTTCHLCSLGEIVFQPDGTFRRPRENKPAFPIGGIDLRWHWDSARGRIVIRFSKNGEPLNSRWDELRPYNFAYILDDAPNWKGVAHIGGFAFTYRLSQVITKEDEK